MNTTVQANRGFKKVKPTEFNNLMDVVKQFPTEKHCREYFEKLRWPDGKIVCQKCGSSEKIYKINEGAIYKCAKCRKQFTIKVGTIFEDSPLSLTKWFMATYLLTAHKKGISSIQLGKDIEVTQQTAWFMMHRIRFAIRQGSFEKPIDGVFEADESYFGGLESNKHQSKRTEGTQGRNTKKKTAVFGIAKRGGDVFTTPIKNVKKNTLQPLIKNMIEKGAIVITDELRSYSGLSVDYAHLTIDHGKGEYVRGFVDTNTMECFWSLFKRGVYGIYHQVSPKHLDKYCNEFTYRFNTRKLVDTDRFTKTLGKTDGRLDWIGLTGKDKNRKAKEAISSPSSQV
jgi:transposase-like protein